MKKSIKITLAIGAALGIIAYATRDTPQEKEAKYLKRGNEFFEQGEYKKARLSYKNASKIIPNDPEVSYRWALVDEAEGDIRNAFINFTYTEQQSPHYKPALLRLAHYHLVAENYDEVKKRLDIVLADTPGDPEAHALLASLLLREKHYAGAEKEARFALEKDKTNITAFSVLTGMYIAQKKIPEAGAVLDQGIAANPRNTDLLMLKIKMYEQSNDIAKIAEAYHQIFELKPSDPQFRILLAQTYIALKQLDNAEKTLREGIAAIPADWFIKRQLINFLAQYRNADVAEKEIKGYMQAFPENSDLYFWLTDLYVNHDATDKAVALLQQIIDKDDTAKQSLSARAVLARIHFAKGDKDLAQKMVDAVLAKRPTNPDALFIRASLEADQGLYHKAVSDLRAIIRDQPKSRKALQLLGEVLLLQGYADLAIETQNQLVELDPGNLPARVRLAQMYATNNDFKRSLELLAIVTQSDPQYALGWENTARVAVGAHDYELANNAIAKLDALEGHHMVATFLKGQISGAGNKSDEADAAYTRCLVPEYDGILYDHIRRDKLWDRYYTNAPARQRHCVEQSKIVKRA